MRFDYYLAGGFSDEERLPMVDVRGAKLPLLLIGFIRCKQLLSEAFALYARGLDLFLISISLRVSQRRIIA